MPFWRIPKVSNPFEKRIVAETVTEENFNEELYLNNNPDVKEAGILSRIRSRVEHVFAVQVKRGGSVIVQAVALVRVRAKVGLRILAYNLD